MIKEINELLFIYHDYSLSQTLTTPQLLCADIVEKNKMYEILQSHPT